VKQGDMEHFKKIVGKYEHIFKRDNNFTLIMRLKHTVLKFGLKKINVAYSKISLADISKKLMIGGTPEDAEHVVAKAIRDGVIDAVIDHDNMWLKSKDEGEVGALLS